MFYWQKFFKDLFTHLSERKPERKRGREEETQRHLPPAVSFPSFLEQPNLDCLGLACVWQGPQTLVLLLLHPRHISRRLDRKHISQDPNQDSFTPNPSLPMMWASQGQLNPLSHNTHLIMGNIFHLFS